MFEKLPVNRVNDTYIKFIKENEKYVVPTSSQWGFSVSKSTLISRLKEALAFTTTHPVVTSSKGQEIPYKMSIVAMVASEGDDLKAFLNSQVLSNLVKTEIEFSDK